MGMLRNISVEGNLVSLRICNYLHVKIDSF